MKSKKIMKKAAALFLAAAMSFSPVMSSLPVYASAAHPVSYAEETDDYVVLPDQDEEGSSVVSEISEEDPAESSVVDDSQSSDVDPQTGDGNAPEVQTGNESMPVDTATADSTMMERIKSSIKVTGNDYYKVDYSDVASFRKTFSVDTEGGSLTLLKTDGTVLDELHQGDTCTLDYYAGTDAPDEVVVYAQADDGYLVENYTGQVVDDGLTFDMDDPQYGILSEYFTRSHYLISDSADEAFHVSFVKNDGVDENAYKGMGEEQGIATFASIDAVDWTTVQAGDTFSGNAKISYNRAKTKTYDGSGKIKMTSGPLSGNRFTMKKCASGHDYWAPTNNMTGKYSFTVREIDLLNGKVKYRIKWTPSNSKAYQTLSTSAEMEIPKAGELIIQKEASIADTNVDTLLPLNLNLTATFGIYKDAACEELVRTEQTDETGYKKVENLEPGTYWVKEIVAPTNLKLDSTPQQVSTTSGISTLVFEDEYWTIDLKLFKKARGVNETGYIPSMAGAVYKLYTDADCTTEATIDAAMGGNTDPGQSDTAEQNIVAFVSNDANPLADGSYPLIWGYMDEFGNLNPYDIRFSVGTKFWIKEVQAPTSNAYELDPDAHAIDFTTEEVYKAAEQGSVALENLIKAEYSVLQENLGVGYVSLYKTSDIDAKDVYSLEGAVYGIYSDETCSTLVNTLQTDANGDTATIEVKCGQYYVKEIQAPEGFAMDTNVYPVTVGGGNTPNSPVVVNSTDKLYHKEFTIKKVASNMTENAPSLEGVEFKVTYYGKDAERKTAVRTWTVKTVAEDRDGQTAYVVRFDENHKVSGDAFYKDNTGKVVLPIGYYSVEETKTADKYTMEGITFDGKSVSEAKNFSIVAGDGKVEIINDFETIENEAVVGNNAYAGIIINKADNETGKRYPLGSASFEGFTFGIYNASGHDITMNGVTYADGDEIEQITTDANGEAKTGEFDLLANGTTYLVKELAGNGSYLIGGSTKVTLTKGGYTDTAQGVDYKNQIIRGDFEFSKKDFKTQSPMADVQFKITSVSTGESHTISTDGNGYYSSASSYAPHSKDTNSGKGEAGTWFGIDKEGNAAAVNDALGALPYDTYTVEELAGENNKNKALISFNVVINRDGYTVQLGTINNFDEANEKISTTAIDKDTKSHIGAPAKESVIIDRVAYENLKADHEYTLVTTLMNKDTAATVMDKNGDPISLRHTFTPAQSNGFVNVNISFDSILLNGGTAVVFEKLYDGDRLIAQHEDITSEEQSVSYPSLTIGTTALDTDTKEHLGVTSETATLTDTIDYENLKPGTKYTIVTDLKNKATGESLKDKDGKAVVKTHEFTPKDKKGSVYVEISFDATQLNGGAVVAFEKIYDGDELVASHEDLNSEEQTVYYPSLKTNAENTEDGSHMAIASEKISITDKVNYKGVVPGKKITVSGTLLNKTDGTPVLDKDGKKVTASVEIKPEESEGTVDVVFEFDGSNLTQGVVIVASEQLEYKGTVYCVHSDLNDADQTIYVPGIRTEAICDDTGLHVLDARENVTIVDTVSYKGLLTNDMMNGDTYRLEGTLMDADTGAAVKVKNEDGSLVEVVAEQDFVAEESEGKVEVKFNLNTKGLTSKNLVVFEKLYRVNADENKTLVASHEDLKDENQTIHTPEIRTTLVNKESGTHHAAASGKVVLTDKVSYSGLIPQKTYKVTGVLKDQATGESILVGGKEVTSEITFTPEEQSGSVDVEFVIEDASVLSGKTVVAFEKLLIQDKELASHEDINDSDQSVSFPEIHTTATDSTKTSHTIMASSKAVIIDTVSYKGLIPGKEYTVSGYLVDKESGNALKAGIFSKVEAKTTFTPEKADGEIEVIFEFDATDIAGKSLVAFEELTCTDEKEPVAEHKDKDDESQTVSIPSIKTTATNENKKLHMVKADEKAVIIDTVTYEGLVKDASYTMKAEVMDPESGNATGVTAEQEFTAEDAAGSVEVSIALDASKYAGKSLVVFETLSTKSATGESAIIAEHRDLKDSDQTITVPKVETNASDGADGDRKMKAEKEATIVDKVTMSGLEDGREVKLVGTVMDKESGKVLAIDDKEVTAETTFKAKSGTFDQELKFEFNASGLKKGTELVVFEKLYDVETGEEIGSHEDLESESQTVTISNEKKDSSDDGKDSGDKASGSDKSSKGVSTSDAVGFIVVFLVLGIGAITAGIVIKKRRAR